MRRSQAWELRNRWFADSSLEEAVRSELVSVAKFPLLAGKMQGNSSVLLSEIRISDRKRDGDQRLADEIPYAAEQGNNFARAGN